MSWPDTRPNDRRLFGIIGTSRALVPIACLRLPRWRFAQLLPDRAGRASCNLIRYADRSIPGKPWGGASCDAERSALHRVAAPSLCGSNESGILPITG